jgi:hypothetical protein
MRPFVVLVALALLYAPAPTVTAQGQAAGRIVAIGDIHGELAGFRAILKAAGLTDAAGQWSGGRSSSRPATTPTAVKRRAR